MALQGFVCLLIFTSLRFTDCQLVNVAAGKRTDSSAVLDERWSSLAVDGNTSLCTELDPTGNYIWWRIDLSKTVVVRQVILHVKAHSMVNSSIYVSGTSALPPDHAPCYTLQADSENDTVEINCDETGRYVIIHKQTTSTTPMILCEVEILVCVDGTYGRACQSTCGTCRSDVCYPISGVCPVGCVDGYQEPLCQHECENGTYGQNCSLECGQCGIVGCNHVTGWCSGGCREGYTGHTCNKTFVSQTEQMYCRAGKYGLNCDLNCGNCGGSGCDHVTGWCHGGCVDGFTGRMCNIKLDSVQKESLSPVIVGVIGAVIMLFVMSFILVIVFCLCMTGDSTKKPTIGRGTVKYNKSKDSSSPVVAAITDPDPPRDLVEHRRPSHHYEELDEARYVATAPASSKHAKVISPSIVVTAEELDDRHQYANADDLHYNTTSRDLHQNIASRDLHQNIASRDLHQNIASRDLHQNIASRDHQHNTTSRDALQNPPYSSVGAGEYVAMTTGQNVYDTVHEVVDTARIEFLDAPPLDTSHTSNAYVDMRESMSLGGNDSYM